MGMAAIRGEPGDYNEWSELGVTGWTWEDVRPYFIKLERDLDFAGPLHGVRGPLPIRRVRDADWAPFSRAVANALERRGFPLVDDCNADFREGVSSLPISNLPDRRMSASMAYLTTSVRRRYNLVVLADAFAERIEFREAQVQGVSVRTRSGVRRYLARNVIVACGAVYSPALLMRSGIGPADHLHELGIQVVRDLASVGRNLQNHPDITIATHLPRSAMQSPSERSWQQNCLRYSSHAKGCSPNDMLVAVTNKGGWHPLGARVGSLRVSVYKPYSKGIVQLASPDPSVQPRVSFNLLSDPRDFERMVAGLRFMLELIADGAVARVRNEVFLPDARIAGRLNDRTPLTWLLAFATAKCLEIPPVRRAALRRGVLDFKAIARDEGALQSLVRQRAQPVGHVTGTCHMGAPADSGAVVDPACRVRGVNGLRVVDASIFPTLMRANTHSPVVMAA